MGTLDKLKESLHPVICDLCGADSTSVLLRHEYPGIFLAIVRCNDCGLIYYTPQPTEEALGEYYSSLEKDAYTPRWQEWYGQLTPERVQTELDHLEFLEHCFLRCPPLGSKQNRSRRFLEVGCAFGHLLHCAKKKNWQPVGVDLSEVAVSWVRRNLGLECIGGTLRDTALRLPKENFDIIVMSHVLEHMLHPTAEVRSAYHLLKPGGILAIYTPNGGGLQARHDFSKWEWTSWPDHLYYFTPSTLRSLVEKAEFLVESLWSCVGHSSPEKLFDLIKERLYLDSVGQAQQMAGTLGPMGMLSDLRVIVRKPTAESEAQTTKSSP